MWHDYWRQVGWSEYFKTTELLGFSQIIIFWFNREWCEKKENMGENAMVMPEVRE